MKKIWILLIIVVVAIGAVIALSATGLMPKLSWQTLTMLAAAFASPFKALFDNFTKKDEVDQIADKQKAVREAEEGYRKEMDAKYAEQQRKLDEINKEIEVKNVKLEVIEEKKKRIAAETKSLTIEQTKSEAKDLFGE
ncbi:MAG: hypothetical protein RIS47_1632 [Bacteroidota bacterium]|jgi:hypothetical protein